VERIEVRNLLREQVYNTTPHVELIIDIICIIQVLNAVSFHLVNLVGHRVQKSTTQNDVHLQFVMLIAYDVNLVNVEK
jgi:hypothetical protein